MNGVYLALLQKEAASPFLQTDAVFEVSSADKGKGKADEAVSITLNPEGISERIIQLPLAAGYYGNYYGNCS